MALPARMKKAMPLPLRTLLAGNLRDGKERKAALRATMPWLLGQSEKAVEALHGALDPSASSLSFRYLAAEGYRQLFRDKLRQSIGSPDGFYLDTGLAQKVIADPQAAFAPWRATRPARILAQASQRWREAFAQPRPGGRRILICSHANWHFTDPVVEALRERSDIEVRTLRGNEIPAPCAMTASNLFLASPDPISMARNNFDKLRRHAPETAAAIEWADVVLADWANEGALWMCNFLPPEKRLIVRLHSFEAFSPWVHFLPWGRLDGMIFVGEPMRGFVDAQFDLSQHSTLEQFIVPNWVRPENWTVEKDADAAFTLGMIVYADANKRPDLALDILQHLVEARSDLPWRLRLVGRVWPEEGMDQREATYRDRFMARIGSGALAGRVTLDPYTNRLHEWFRQIGFAISASERESQSLAITQAMAAGCVPLVRDWPLTQDYGGPAAIYDTAFIWQDSHAAADYILATAIDDTRMMKVRSAVTSEIETRFARRNAAANLTAALTGEADQAC